MTPRGEFHLWAAMCTYYRKAPSVGGGTLDSPDQGETHRVLLLQMTRLGLFSGPSCSIPTHTAGAAKSSDTSNPLSLSSSSYYLGRSETASQMFYGGKGQKREAQERHEQDTM